MSAAKILLLTLVFAGPLHAQVCSGGSGGGADATGNQCNDGVAVGAYADGSDIASPPRTAKMSGIEPSGTARIGPRPTATVSAAHRSPTEEVKGVSRVAVTVVPPQLPVKTSKVEVRDSSPCSGGSDGGTDATGNQCNATSVAELNPMSPIDAKRHEDLLLRRLPAIAVVGGTGTAPAGGHIVSLCDSASVPADCLARRTHTH